MGRTAPSQVYNPVDNPISNQLAGSNFALNFMFGGGPAARSPEQVSYRGLYQKHQSEKAADKQSAARSGVVHGGSGGGGSGGPAAGRIYDQVQATRIGGAVPRNADGTWDMGFMSSKDNEMRDYYSPDTSSRRVTGDDQGPMLLLKQFQGSNRGSGGYIAQVPRYSIAETRKTWDMSDKKNFLALNRHPGKKHLEPGTEWMRKRQRDETGGARRVTRKFL